MQHNMCAHLYNDERCDMVDVMRIIMMAMHCQGVSGISFMQGSSIQVREVVNLSSQAHFSTRALENDRISRSKPNPPE